jgi:preprotein translocase subunit Sss1
MDKKLEEKIEQKINETATYHKDLHVMIKSFKHLSSGDKSFAYGLIIGRLYNSFYYQCRRILKRDPTEEEFLEFIEIIKNHDEEFPTRFCF